MTRYDAASMARARADARPLPRRGGLRRARRRARSSTRSTATASRPSCCCRPGRSSTRATGRRRSRTSRATSASSPSTGAATGAPTARAASSAYAEREFAADALAVHGRHGDRARGRSSRLSVRRAVGDAARRRPPRARAAARLHRPGGPARARRIPSARSCARFEEELDDATRAGRSTTATTGSATTAASSSSSSAQMFTEPHSTKQIEDCVGWALETDPETLADTTAALSPVPARAVRATCARASAAPCS